MIQVICPDCGTEKKYVPTGRRLSKCRVKCINPNCDKSFYVGANRVRL